MPDGPSGWLPKSLLLDFDALEMLARCFATLGVSRIRLTGGEPLLRTGLPQLVRRLAAIPGVEDLALTTNGVTLEKHARALAEAGLQRLTISLDSLRADRLRTLTGGGDLNRIVRGIRAAVNTGLPVKINTVVLRDTNVDELIDLLDFASSLDPSRPVELRFIEYMDVGPCGFDPARLVRRSEILKRIEAARGVACPQPSRGSAPAERFRLSDGTPFGIIAATSQPFCGACDRVRLTAAGHVYTCLHGTDALDLGTAIRAGASPAELAARIRTTWSRRADRGAEAALAQNHRRLPLARRQAMHAMGG
jgi:GTP 3',8-cyclase